MRVDVLHRTQRLGGSPQEVFPFSDDAVNLDAITPPLLRFGSRTTAGAARR